MVNIAKKVVSIVISLICTLSILIIYLLVPLYGGGNFANLTPQMSHLWFKAVEILPFASVAGLVVGFKLFKQQDQNKWMLFTLICSCAGLAAYFVLVVIFTGR